MLNILILCPFTILFGLTYLYLLLGWTFFPGLLVFFLFMALNLVIVKKGLYFLKEFMRVRGQRIKRTNEVFNNIKLIKSYSLERFFLKKIVDIRRVELNWLKLLFFRNIFTMVNSSLGPGVFLLTIFATYSAAGYQLTAGKIFTTISIFNSFIWALNYLPNIFSNFIDMLTSSERLTKYLLSPQIEKWPNLFLEDTLTAASRTSPRVERLFAARFERQAAEREALIRETRREYCDPQDQQEVPLSMRRELRRNRSLFDQSYRLGEEAPRARWALEEGDKRRFAGTALDVQISSLDFFWSRFWVAKTEDEKEQERKDRLQKAKIAKMMGGKKKAKTDSESECETDADTTRLSLKSAKTGDSESSKSNKFHLKNINLEIQKGEFVCVIGKSGSGKSTLFQSILGELFARPAGLVDPQVDPEEHGPEEASIEELAETPGSYLNYNANLSYLSQKPWIRNATLKENIIFGHPFEEKKYKECVEFSGLEDDLKILKDGDETVIGDKGINLSGGQKVRVGLARALYNATDLYLLDDPLSALDVNVGNHVFMKALKGYLRDRTRIVITHSLGYLKHFDRVIFMDEGRIIYDGSFEGLQDKPFYIGRRREANERPAGDPGEDQAGV